LPGSVEGEPVKIPSDAEKPDQAHSKRIQEGCKGKTVNDLIKKILTSTCNSEI